MIRPALVAAALCSIASISFASDKITLKLSANELISLDNALLSLDGSQKIAHDALGHEVVVSSPYKLGDARLTIAHDEWIIKSKIEEARFASSKLDLKTAEGAKAEVQLENDKQDVDLLTLKVEGLELKENDIPASVLSGLASICPTCVGSDSAK